MTSLMKNHNNGFTLIEMLAVLFIMGILFSLTLPAFGPMLRTLKLTTSAENLANTLESARQYAITSGQYCYIVFPTSTGTDKDHKAYKLYSYDGENGKSIGKWEMLNNGLSVDSSSTFLTHKDNQKTINIPFPDDNSGSQVALRYIFFNSSGKANIRASVKIIDSQKSDAFECVTFYNSPAKVKVWDLGEEPKDEK